MRKNDNFDDEKMKIRFEYKISLFWHRYRIYLAGKYLKWVRKNGGVSEMERRAGIKSKLIYDEIDKSNGFYYNGIEKRCRR